MAIRTTPAPAIGRDEQRLCDSRMPGFDRDECARRIAEELPVSVQHLSDHIARGGILTRGARGKQVDELQSALELVEGRDRFGRQGYYGSETRSVVRTLQRRHGLNPDGRYGPNTHAALMQELGQIADRSVARRAPLTPPPRLEASALHPTEAPRAARERPTLRDAYAAMAH